MAAMNERDQARFAEMITRFVDARRCRKSERTRKASGCSPFSQDGVGKSARITVVVARTVSQ
jgi:hypothetical protein